MNGDKRDFSHDQTSVTTSTQSAHIAVEKLMETLAGETR